jgi:hypothetical protein
MRGCIVFTAGLFFCFNLFSQNKSYPSIEPPLKIPLTLSGTFCELRNTHFHAGIDLRTEGREGLEVYAVEEGFVSRIRISGSGYGKALYIDHPNGYTSVYGHLQRYHSEIEAFARSLQYAKESFEIDTVLPANLLMVRKGQHVAFSGNTGSSQAPHLHFEMRETVTEAPVNPKLFGLYIIDNVAPVPSNILLYDLEDGGKQAAPVKLKLINKGNIFGLAKDTVRVNTTILGVAIHVNDYMEESDNSNGIYELTLKVDGKRRFHFQFNQLSAFDDVRYVLAHMDNAVNKMQGIRFHRCFRLPGNYLQVYEPIAGNGYIELRQHEIKKIEITVSDLCKNTASVQFYIKADTLSDFFKKHQRKWDKILSYHEPATFEREEIKITFPDSAFYNNVYFNYSLSDQSSMAMAFSSMHQVHTDLEPCHRAFSISVMAKNFPDYLRDKAVLVRENYKGSRTALPGKWHENFYTTHSKEFGKFYISIDTAPPAISAINLYPNKLMKEGERIRFRISDNLSGIHSFDMYIDGQWVLAEYDAKNNLIWYDLGKQIEPGVHEIVLTVSDVVSNISVYKTRFRK